jgi:protein-S-isoprenylcysteine O-methyltransferase Ste14
MMGCVGAMCWLYELGAVLEEGQFLRGEELASGQTVGKQVKDEYEEYARQVRYRWVPGIL